MKIKWNEDFREACNVMVGCENHRLCQALMQPSDYEGLFPTIEDCQRIAVDANARNRTKGENTTATYVEVTCWLKDPQSVTPSVPERFHVIYDSNKSTYIIADQQDAIIYQSGLLAPYDTTKYQNILKSFSKTDIDLK